MWLWESSKIKETVNRSFTFFFNGYSGGWYFNLQQRVKYWLCCMASFRYSRIGIENENIAVKMSNTITLSISVDLTFNLGAYDFARFTYRNAVFHCKSKT